MNVVKLSQSLTFYLDIYCCLLRYDDSTTKKMFSSKIKPLTLLIKEKLDDLPELSDVYRKYNDIRTATVNKIKQESEREQILAGGNSE